MLNTHDTCIFLDSLRINAFNALKNARNASNTAYAAMYAHKQAVDTAFSIIEPFTKHIYNHNVPLFIALLQYYLATHTFTSFDEKQTRDVLQSIVQNVKER